MDQAGESKQTYKSEFQSAWLQMKAICVFHFPSQDPFCHARPKTQGGALAKKLKHYSDFVDFERKLKS